ncbi:MAG TPA: SDR family oxidoreductase [Nanoarchaeota archaeon]|nr:SDR family oxidoreductase [Nanoarchaeota archaeon]HIH63865.1 SDR family oxidoreductase [Nanoarchaeota archaeon]HIJ09764.1 SDR family oxidoreductase [Nanoarchaeota archaeon]
MNETALITGSSKGLGKELALVFAENGYNIILHGRDEKDLQRVQEEVSKYGVEGIVVRGDLKYPETIKALYSEAKRKDISVLINNAGTPCPGLPLNQRTPEQTYESIIINLISPIQITQRIYEHFLKKNEGTIININSFSGITNQKFRTIHCANKWGLKGFTDTLKLEAKENGIYVIGVYPTRIKTRPEFTYGLDPKELAKKIYTHYNTKNIEDIIIDGRPKEFKK